MKKQVRRIGFVLSTFLLLFAVGTAEATSAFFDTSAATAYSAVSNDILTDYAWSGYDAVGSDVIGYASGSMRWYQASTGNVHDMGLPEGETGWNSFVLHNSDTYTTYVGFTGGDNGDKIYRVNFNHQNRTFHWNEVTDFANNFDLEFYNGDAFVSGLNDSDWSTPNSIWRMDDSGAGDHDKIVEVSGSSAGLAFDGSGNLYYASYDGELYRWDAADVAGAIGEGYLTYADGTKLSDLEQGAYDVEVDDAGHVIFNGNGGYSYTAMWNGTEGDGYNYDYIGIGAGEYGDWFTYIDAEGDVTADGSLYQADIYYFGLAEVNPVPVPAAAWLLGSGLIALVGIRRKNN